MFRIISAKILEHILKENYGSLNKNTHTHTGRERERETYMPRITASNRV